MRRIQSLLFLGNDDSRAKQNYMLARVRAGFDANGGLQQAPWEIESDLYHRMEQDVMDIACDIFVALTGKEVIAVKDAHYDGGIIIGYDMPEDQQFQRHIEVPKGKLPDGEG